MKRRHTDLEAWKESMSLDSRVSLASSDQTGYKEFMKARDQAARVIDEKLLRAIRQDVPGLVALYLFGSAASVGMRKDSDLDLALLAERAVDPQTLSSVRERVEQAAGRDVHLIDLRRASTVFRHQVVATGHVLLDRAPAAREFFEATAFSDYTRLNEERKGILDDVTRKGTVYAR